VVGKEKVTVPAGQFDAWKVEVVNPSDGGKTLFWVGPESRNVLRIQATMPQLNGATMTMERLP